MNDIPVRITYQHHASVRSLRYVFVMALLDLSHKADGTAGKNPLYPLTAWEDPFKVTTLEDSDV